MPNEKLLKKPKKQVRVMKSDLKDLIRDEIYGAGHESRDDCDNILVCIPKKFVKVLAKRIAHRAIIGH